MNQMIRRTGHHQTVFERKDSAKAHPLLYFAYFYNIVRLDLMSHSTSYNPVVQIIRIRPKKIPLYLFT